MSKLKSFHSKGLIEVGCDEAGRGCLSGPVVAASVILPKNFSNSTLNDSKKLSEKQRLILEPFIREKSISCEVGIVMEHEIDKINILNASFLAMHRSLRKHSLLFDHILVDGNRFPSFEKIKHTCIVGGDAKFMAIAAASVIAKNFRDRWMQKIHKKFPEYAWDKNKGYPTKAHREAIFKYGVTKYHRKSFNLLGDLAQFNLFS